MKKSCFAVMPQAYSAFAGRSSPQDKKGANIFNQGNDRGWRKGRETKGEQSKQKTAKKTELIVDNNLLWRSKAYSFGHFVRNLRGDATHV